MNVCICDWSTCFVLRGNIIATPADSCKFTFVAFGACRVHWDVQIHFSKIVPDSWPESGQHKRILSAWGVQHRLMQDIWSMSLGMTATSWLNFLSWLSTSGAEEPLISFSDVAVNYTCVYRMGIDNWMIKKWEHMNQSSESELNRCLDSSWSIWNLNESDSDLISSFKFQISSISNIRFQVSSFKIQISIFPHIFN